MATATTAEATVSERLLSLVEKQLSKNCIYDGQRCLSGGDIAKLVDADPDPLKCYRYNHSDLFQEDVDFVKGEFGYVFYTRSGFLKFKPYVRSKYNRRSSYNNYNSGYNSRHETVDIVFDTILEKYFDVPVSEVTTVTDAVVEDTDTTNKESEEMGSVENTAVAVNEAITFTTFENSEFGNLRVAMIDNEPWFVASDVCSGLEIKNSRDALSRLDDDEKGVALTDTLGGKQTVATINEPGLYTLVLSSRKPEAKAFKRWITHDIIPSLRKNGVYVSNTAKATESVGANLSTLSNEDAMLYILLKEETQNKIIGNLIQSQQNWMAVQQKHNEEFRKEVMSYFKEFGDSVAKTVSDFMTQQMNNSQNLNTTISNALECVQSNSNSHTSSIENICESLKSLVSGIGQIAANAVSSSTSSTSSESAATDNEETEKEETVKADYDPAWRNRTLAWANMYAAKHGISNANLVLGNMYSAIDNKYNVNIRKLRSEYARKRMLTRLSVIDFIATFRKTRDIFDEIIKGIMEGEEKEKQVHQNNDVVQNQAMSSQSTVTSAETTTETESIYKAQEKKMQNYNARYKRFCQLKDDGVSMTEIAKLLGLSYSTLFAYTYNGRYYKEHKLAG